MSGIPNQIAHLFLIRFQKIGKHLLDPVGLGAVNDLLIQLRQTLIKTQSLA